jgi:hypothetical protein
MSKKGCKMDLYFQKWNIRRYLHTFSIESDTIDINGLLDSTLHYYENEENISKLLMIRYNKYK